LPISAAGQQFAQAQMYAMQPIELIAKFLSDRLGVERQQVLGSAVLADLGVDSLMLAELMFEAEDSLGIVVDADMDVPQTVGQMAALLDSLLAAKALAA
jgi:acyl carrier protein